MLMRYDDLWYATSRGKLIALSVHVCVFSDVCLVTHVVELTHLRTLHTQMSQIETLIQWDATRPPVPLQSFNPL